jgi:predicted phosphodiesterase
MPREIHVAPEEDHWTVEVGDAGIGSIHETKEEALAEARALALEERASVVIHGGDGQIRDREDPDIILAELDEP